MNSEVGKRRNEHDLLVVLCECACPKENKVEEELIGMCVRERGLLCLSVIIHLNVY